MITILGTMPEPILRTKYYVKAKEVNDTNYGIQYKIENISVFLPNGIKSPLGRKTFLQALFTEQQVDAMYEKYEDPYQILLEQDVQKLVQIKGCGMKTAQSWISRFEENYKYSMPIVELSDMKISDSLMKKIVEFYGSPDIAVKAIKEDPYSLINISGIGWSKCDAIAMQTGNYNKTYKRVEAYIKYHLNNMANNGYSYIPTDIFAERKLNIKAKGNTHINLMDNLMDFFGDDLQDSDINQAIKEMEKILWFNKDHTLIGLQKYRNLEEEIAKELIRIRDAKNNFNFTYEEAEHTIQKREEYQGWNYTDQQKRAIFGSLENQVMLIVGKAGTGKSTIVSGILDILKDYSFAQTALAGRAAARMSEITKQEGYTIHRLLEYPLGDPENGMFLRNKSNPLHKDIIILDEISMVDGELFLRLLQAIPDGTKLIMLGDVGQLESIGYLNIANDLLHSDSIVSIELTEIHRQAQDSAIITESHKARKGEMIVKHNWTGTEIRGKLQDLAIDCYSDSSNTFYKIMQYASSALDTVEDIMDFIVIVPNKKQQAGTYNINAGIQELYNPKNSSKKELLISKDGLSWVLREGDKVINTENYYEAKIYNEEDSITSVYNGNMGIIKKINIRKKQVIIYFSDLKKTIIFNKEQLRNIELGYCVTCHKYQGSQAKNVIVGIDFSSYALLTRQWVYTALTRAMSKCVLVAQTGALRFAISQNGVSVKQTHLQSILYNLDHPKLIF